MEDKNKKNGIASVKVSHWVDWLIAAIFAATSSILFFASMVDYAYPGISARLKALWMGLDVSPYVPYPLMQPIAALFGYGNAISPICGAVAVAGIYVVVSCFLRTRFNAEEHGGEGYLITVPRIGGAVAASVFLLSPCVRLSASRLDPVMFDFALVVLTLLLAIPVASANVLVHSVSLIAIGVLAGLGFADTPLFLIASPLFAFAIAVACKSRGSKKPWRKIGIAAFTFVVVFLAYSLFTECADYSAYIDEHLRMFSYYASPSSREWFAIFIIATLPSLLSLVAARRAFRAKGSLALWIHQSVLSLIAFFAVVTPMSPSDRMAPYGICPVESTGLVAFVAGFVISWWWLQARRQYFTVDKEIAEGKKRKVVAAVAILMCVSAATFAIASVFSLVRFDRTAGAFADKVADRIISDLGGRDWFITDGTLDDHLRLAAKRAGKELKLVCLQRDFDKTYVEYLSSVILKSGIGGAYNKDLTYSLKLGILPFVQDWIAWDPEVAKKLAIYGAPDLWRYKEDVDVVPEFLFFGADKSVKYDDKAWDSMKETLYAPEKWGSYRLWKESDPIKRMRLNIRRHAGFVANNRGVMLEDAGKKDEAFEAYEHVLNDIDFDNVCALFNEIEMMGGGYRKALAKKGTLTRRFNEIKDDPDRRYRLIHIYNYYGYIRNPDIFIRYGVDWARFGRPGEALNQIRRAIDFIPSENRKSLMNILAALYASEQDRAKSRSMYEAVLEKDSSNHDALVGLMRLEMLNGNNAKALEYLEKAIAESGDDPRVRVEMAMAHLMKGETAQAIKLLRAAAESAPDNMQTWSLLAAAIMQQIDSEKDPKKKSELAKSLEEDVLAAMEKQSRSPTDYYLQTTRAFLLLHKGEKFRKEARDAFARAARQHPGAVATADIILGLDIALNDVADAEREAKEALKKNRKAPLANYVMGSIALQRGDYQEAESFLRRSIDNANPIPLALNDYAEVLRRRGSLDEAERYARRTTEVAPALYVAWDTLASIILEKKGSLDEAEQCILKACELSKDEKGREKDVRMLITLARVQKAKGDMLKAKMTARSVTRRLSELSEYERQEFEEFMKGVK